MTSWRMGASCAARSTSGTRAGIAGMRCSPPMVADSATRTPLAERAPDVYAAAREPPDRGQAAGKPCDRRQATRELCWRSEAAREFLKRRQAERLDRTTL